MSTSGDPAVFYILIPIFLALGIYLIIYNKKKSSMFRSISAARGMSYQNKDDGQIERMLSDKIKIEEQNYVRTISNVKDIIQHGEIHIFRCTELLDLYKWGNPQNTHHQRVVLFFNVPQDASLFFFVNPEKREYKSMYPANKNLNEDRFFKSIKTQIEKYPPPHPISVTLSRGAAFIYLEPMIAGGEKKTDIDYLFNLGEKLKEVTADF